MYQIGDYVQIVNHDEPACSGRYGHVTAVQIAYDGHTYYYTVEFEDSPTTCVCIADELMEG